MAAVVAASASTSAAHENGAPAAAAVPTPFPARSKTKTASILGVSTTATAFHFSDKILITLSQNGKLGHWIHVPLTPSPTTDLPQLHGTASPSTALLPDTHITATTILGGTLPALDTLGQTLATHLASAIAGADPREGRMLVLGLGFARAMDRITGDVFAELVGLALDVL